MGCPDIWLNITLGVSQRPFLDETQHPNWSTGHPPHGGPSNPLSSTERWSERDSALRPTVVEQDVGPPRPPAWTQTGATAPAHLGFWLPGVSGSRAAGPGLLSLCHRTNQFLITSCLCKVHKFYKKHCKIVSFPFVESWFTNLRYSQRH